METGNRVQHAHYGVGTVEIVDGSRIVVNFGGTLQFVGSDDLTLVTKVDDLVGTIAINNHKAITRAQGLLIDSLQRNHGVFSPGNIDLLPHQLWVCNQACASTPIRKLIADDVGLGKTIEAGLILSSLIAQGRADRILVLTPASLVKQWQNKMRKMFSIHLAVYSNEYDSDADPFFDANDRVIASFHTLRKKNESRHDRLYESKPFDIVIVDEAHHFNVHKDDRTLALRLLSNMNMNGLIRSLILFTGTPHRGFDEGFVGLLSQLNPEEFRGKSISEHQLPLLKNYVIRNNKALVTDRFGNKLFRDPIHHHSEYSVTPEEQAFTDELTSFITAGLAFSSRTGSQSSVILILLAILKLATSSTYAVTSSLRNRIARLNKLAMDDSLDVTTDDDDNRVSAERDIASTSIRLVENEIEALDKLITKANEVTVETKLQSIVELLQGDLKDKSVLLFTEYKTTQAKLISMLRSCRPHSEISFINGDGRLFLPDGIQIQSDRFDAATSFNEGSVKILVATEAGGEGIDLHKSAYHLIHIDLPWNPMRLHQRVGRLNRYGQTQQVHVHFVRNPDSLESYIWDLLTNKLTVISRALGGTMDDPEDISKLVLGVQNESTMVQLLTSAMKHGGKSGPWLDRVMNELARSNEVKSALSIIGNVDQFAFDKHQDYFADASISDIRQFVVNYFDIEEPQDGTISIPTPSNWFTRNNALKRRYSGLTFDRHSSNSSYNLCSGTHPLVLEAIRDCQAWSDNVAKIGLDHPVFLFNVQSKMADSMGRRQSSIVCVDVAQEISIASALDVLRRLNSVRSVATSKKSEVKIPESMNRQRCKEHVQQYVTTTLGFELDSVDIREEMLLV
jgi:ERCC4-related helicase